MESRSDCPFTAVSMASARLPFMARAQALAPAGWLAARLTWSFPVRTRTGDLPIDTNVSRCGVVNSMAVFSALVA